MDFSSIRDTFDHVSKKQKVCSSKAHDVIDQLGRQIELALEKMQSIHDTTSISDCKSTLTELHKKLNEIGAANQLEGSQKELAVELRQYSDLLQKSFTSDISKAYWNVEFDFHMVNQILACYFYRQGLFCLGDCFTAEAREPESATIKSTFLEMYQILDAMKCRNFERALNWATTHRDRLMLNGSCIEFKLHHLQFVDILQKKSGVNAVQYAKTYLAPFASLRMVDLQKLMGSILWVGRVDCSPYVNFLFSIHLEELAEELTLQFCNLLGQSYDSPLKVVIEAGVQGLPFLLKMVQVMSTQKQEWQLMKQLPAPVELGSVFVCPVTRDEASEENPPMLLPCGHVLCKQSVLKLSEDDTGSIFKCSYCRLQATVAQCRQLNL